MFSAKWTVALIIHTDSRFAITMSFLHEQGRFWEKHKKEGVAFFFCLLPHSFLYYKWHRKNSKNQHKLDFSKLRMRHNQASLTAKLSKYAVCVRLVYIQINTGRKDGKKVIILVLVIVSYRLSGTTSVNQLVLEFHSWWFYLRIYMSYKCPFVWVCVSTWATHTLVMYAFVYAHKTGGITLMLLNTWICAVSV